MQHEVSGPDERDSKDTDADQPPTRNRKRVSRACNRCRAKKDRCDGQRPSCTPCVTANLDCSYQQATKKRGLPEGYVRGLEKLWALSIGKIAGLEDAVSQITDEHHQQLLELWNHDVTGEDLHTVWKESKILADLEDLLAGLEREVPTGSKRKRDKDDEGDTPEKMPSSLHRQVQYQVSPSSLAGQELQMQRPPSATITYSNIRVTLPEEASKLLDHYFTYTHCWFPILARPQVLRIFYEHSRKGDADKSSNPDLAVLYGIFAYTSALCRDTQTHDVDGEKARRIARATELRRIARSFIPDETKPFELGHVQALLLLSLLDIGLGDWNSSWILIGIAVRAALELRLRSNGSDNREIGSLQGCLILDTLVSNHLEQPAHLRRSDIKLLGHMEEDGLEEWEPWNPAKGGSMGHQGPGFMISCFNRLFDVFLVLNDIVSFTYSDETVRQTYFGKCAEELNALQSGFPIPLSSTAELPPHHIYLRLFYYSTSIAALRYSFEDGARMVSLAKIAFEMLGILTKYIESPILRVSELPAIIELPARSACYAAIARKPEFGTGDLPPYTTFAQDIAGHVSRISATWPVYSSLSGLWQSFLPSEDLPRNGTLPSPSNSRNQRSGQDTFPFLQPGTFEKSFPPLDWHANSSRGESISHLSFDSPIPTMTSDHMQTWPASGKHAEHFSSADLGQTLNDGILRAVGTPLHHHGRESIDLNVPDTSDMSMSGVDQFSPAGLAMPAVDSSPSFHGDDVDAIFHNLVHLDTTEWTNSRSQGLKDFGFADDMTFQAFCNDPERLATPGAPFDQTGVGGSDFWATGSVPTFPSTEKYQSQEERVGWWG